MVIATKSVSKSSIVVSTPIAVSVTVKVESKLVGGISGELDGPAVVDSSSVELTFVNIDDTDNSVDAVNDETPSSVELDKDISDAITEEVNESGVTTDDTGKLVKPLDDVDKSGGTVNDSDVSDTIVDDLLI